MTDDRLDLIYAELPTLVCRGKCAESCGPIAMSPLERERVTATAGREPDFDETLTCNLLVDERCSAYAVRPTICRLWGLVESMPCLWGCKPSRYLSDAEGYDFLRRVDAVNVA